GAGVHGRRRHAARVPASARRRDRALGDGGVLPHPAAAGGRVRRAAVGRPRSRPGGAGATARRRGALLSRKRAVAMRTSRLSRMLSTPVLALGVLVVCVGLLAQAWLGYRATNEWQRSSSLLVARRAKDSIDVMMTALSRDMSGVQTTVLSSRDWDARSFTRPYEARALVARAFARYPYPRGCSGWGP